MKKYRVNDLQGCNFMEDTQKEPMTMNALRARFWATEDNRTKKYSQFTKEYISNGWGVEFEVV